MTSTNLSVRVPGYIPQIEMPDLQHKLEQFVLLLYPRRKSRVRKQNWTDAFAGKWEDDIPADEQVDLIRNSRTFSRTIDL